MQFYTDSKGGLFPPSWLHFSKEMRDTLKIRVWELKPKESRALISDEEAHANFLVGVLAAWIIDMKTSLNETGAKGAGESGLASAPTVRPSLELIDEMSAFMAAAASTGDPLSGPFWQTYGTHVELRTAINRLTSMRTLLASLEESERGAVEDTLYALDAVYLSFLLGPLVDRPGEEMADAPARDEAHGVMLAKKLGDVMVGFPMVLSSNLSATEQVQLSSIEAILRTVGREARTMPPTPSIRSFLRQLLPSELLRLGTLVALIRRKTTT